MFFDPTTIHGICGDTDARLWEAYARNMAVPCSVPEVSRLVFPTYAGARSGEIRVSEQEARFAFAEAVQASGTYYYSVETPTRAGYQLTGRRPISAQTDLTLYDRDGGSMLNVEFKSKGASPFAKSQLRIEKDVQKLLREPAPGLWFHVLEAVNSHTISNLLGVLAGLFSKVAREMPSNVGAKQISFHLCVLKHGFSIHKAHEIQPSVPGADQLRQCLAFSYSASRYALLSVIYENGWTVHHRPTLRPT